MASIITPRVSYHRDMASRFLFAVIVIAIAAAALAPIPSARSTAAQPPASADVSQSRFPAGPGRDALFKVCNNCHGPESVLGQLKTHDEWRKTLDEMANNGAQGSDEEWNQILAYLDKNYSLIFINKATAKDLESTLDVAAAVAEAIVGRRTEQGDYKSIDDLKQVPGVAAAAIEARKDRFIF
jgi:competence protein ComEA